MKQQDQRFFFLFDHKVHFQHYLLSGSEYWHFFFAEWIPEPSFCIKTVIVYLYISLSQEFFCMLANITSVYFADNVSCME